jgi:L-alanine-DL-glutamate epimerase-like enolase superfamily enzyme
MDISAGSIRVPDGLGLGIVLDEAKLEKYRMQQK